MRSLSCRLGGRHQSDSRSCSDNRLVHQEVTGLKKSRRLVSAAHILHSRRLYTLVGVAALKNRKEPLCTTNNTEAVSTPAQNAPKIAKVAELTAFTTTFLNAR